MSDHTERIIRFDRGRDEGVLETLTAARRFLYDTPRAMAATHLAWALPGAVVHFWDDKGFQHFVAHEEDELVGAPLDHFESRSLPISRHLGREALVGDGAPADDEKGVMQSYIVRLTDHIPLDAFIRVEATSEEEAMAIVTRDFAAYAAEADNEAMERLEVEVSNWEGFSPSDIQEAEPMD